MENKIEKMENNFVVVDEKEFNQKLERIKQEGFAKLHVLTDFDKTLTSAFVDGEDVPSLISILRRDGYLTEDYSGRAYALYDYYHPLEIDNTLPRLEKAQAMEEWWRKHFALLIECGLERRDIEKAVQTRRVRLRSGAAEFLRGLQEKNVPIVIISAAGLGREGIELFLKEQGLLSDNIHIISNSFSWNENGKIIAVNEPVIHVLNKNEAALKESQFYEEIKARPNVLLLGDSLEDIAMAEGLEHDTILKIGFLNKKVEENLTAFKEVYDAVVLHDGDFEGVRKLIF